MTKEIQNFITYMCEVKQISKNTELSYERDLRKMSVFLQEQEWLLYLMLRQPI